MKYTGIASGQRCLTFLKPLLKPVCQILIFSRQQARGQTIGQHPKTKSVFQRDYLGKIRHAGFPRFF